MTNFEHKDGGSQKEKCKYKQANPTNTDDRVLNEI